MNNDTSNKQYAVRIYTDSSTADKQAEGQPAHRLVSITYKTPEKEKGNDKYRKPAARCISIPVLSITVEPAVLSAALTTAFHEMQEAVIRDRINAELAKDPQGQVCVLDFTDSDISPEAVAAYMQEKAVSGKLSKAVLEKWYAENLEPQLCVKLAEVLKLPPEPSAAETAVLEAALKQHGSMIAALASPKASLPENVAKQLRTAVRLAADDRTKQALLAKLEAFCQPKEVTLSIGLGE